MVLAQEFFSRLRIRCDPLIVATHKLTPTFHKVKTFIFTSTTATRQKQFNEEDLILNNILAGEASDEKADKSDMVTNS